MGTCPGLMLGGVHGDDEVEVYKKLCQVVDEWIELYAADGRELPSPTAGKKYSGRFVIRVGSELHKSLAIGALTHNKSLNEHCVRLLQEASSKYEP